MKNRGTMQGHRDFCLLAAGVDNFALTPIRILQHWQLPPKLRLPDDTDDAQ
jgi:hypothetical protein